MCTVAILPVDGGHYLLGHNRDEKKGRGRARAPGEAVEWDGRLCLAPVDPDGGGSWILVNDAGLTVCLLNAAEDDPSRLPARPTSRGLVVTALAGCSSATQVEESLARMRAGLASTRAFHLIAVEPRPGSGSPDIVRIAWNGSELASSRLSAPALFVSNPSRQEEAEQARGDSFHRFLAESGESRIDNLRAWLANHEPSRGPLSTCMHREEAGTVSRTLVSVTAGETAMFYTDGAPCDPASGETRTSFQGSR